MRPHAIGLLALVAGAACSPPASTCKLDTIVAADAVMQTNVADCGTFNRGDAIYVDQAMLVAQQCVLGAIKRGQPFRLVYDGKTAADLTRAAFTGALVAQDGKMVMRLRAYVAAGTAGADAGGSAAEISVRNCGTVIEAMGCKASVGAPCLTCDKVTGAANICAG